MSDCLIPATETSSGLPSGPDRLTFACPAPVMWICAGSWVGSVDDEPEAVSAVDGNHGLQITYLLGFSSGNLHHTGQSLETLRMTKASEVRFAGRRAGRRPIRVRSGTDATVRDAAGRGFNLFSNPFQPRFKTPSNIRSAVAGGRRGCSPARYRTPEPYPRGGREGTQSDNGVRRPPVAAFARRTPKAVAELTIM